MWLSSYLSDMSQFVNLDEINSDIYIKLYVEFHKGLFIFRTYSCSQLPPALGVFR